MNLGKRFDAIFFGPSGMAATIALCAFAPIVAISAINWFFFRSSAVFSPTSLHETIGVFKSFFTPAPDVRVDSWDPMKQALQVLGGAGKDSLYETLFFGQGIRFQYPPTSLLPLDLLNRLGLGGTTVLNGLNSALFLVNALCVAFLAHLFASKSPLKANFPYKDLDRWAVPLIAFVGSFVFYPAVHAVILGQIQVWIDLLFTLACVAWLYDRRGLAGALVGATCMIKPQFALLLLWALCWREWIFAKGFLIISIPVALLSVALYGLHNHIAYLDVLSFFSKHGESFFANNSVNGIVNRYLGNGTNLRWEFFIFPPFNPLVYGATIGASILALAAIAAPPLLRRGNPTIFDFGAATVLAVMGSPVAWEHHYGVMLPLYALLLQSLHWGPEGRARTLRLAALAISWLLSANLMPFVNLLAGTPLNFIQAYLFFGALILVPLLLMEAWRYTRSSPVDLHERAASPLPFTNAVTQ